MGSDNLFDRLADLFRSNGPVNWRLAREIAESVAGEPEPVEPWLAEEYRELATTAGMRIGAASPLDPSSGTADVQPVDRRTWTSENVEAFSDLAEPIAEKMTHGGSFGSALLPLAPALIGMQMGAAIGFISHSVLGRFDVGIPLAQESSISFVVPNIEAFAVDHDLDPRQTRLWVALHEVTYQAEFDVPWVREHLLMLMHVFVEGLEIDSDEISRRIEDFQDPDVLQRALDDPSGFSGLLASKPQEGTEENIQAFMAVIEGYADYLIDRAAPGLIPEAPRIIQAIDRRRAEPSQGEQILHQALGLDLQHQQYRLGVGFCEEVDRRWGDETLGRMWEDPAMLPTLGELKDVVGWAARVLL